jgi:hypothetical protein
VLFALTLKHRTPSQVTSVVSHPPTRHVASTPPPGITRTVAVSAKTGWQSTNIYLTDGEKFTIRYVSGTWTVDTRNFPYVSPAGYSNSVNAEIYQYCKYDTARNYGVLLGVVGSKGHEFPIGEGGQFVAVAPSHYNQGGGNGGYLYLRINDDDACLGDNAGSVTMQVSTS